uniref:MyoD family inhibitor n=1 Tax=Strix occidentalis caurina TaxID=311401 RepID=A0A8D0EUW0_STROC
MPVLLQPCIPWGLSGSICPAHRDPQAWAPAELPSWQPSGAEWSHLMSSKTGLSWGLGRPLEQEDFHPYGAEHPSAGCCLTQPGPFPPLPTLWPFSADCCVHCILSCLFCEFLTLCNIVLDCATCGSCTSEDSCICCCCCNSGECADCDLPCDMDCGIIDACCESADCLEICMECCGLCFSS